MITKILLALGANYLLKKRKASVQSIEVDAVEIEDKSILEKKEVQPKNNLGGYRSSTPIRPVFSGHAPGMKKGPGGKWFHPLDPVISLEVVKTSKNKVSNSPKLPVGNSTSFKKPISKHQIFIKKPIENNNLNCR